MTLKKWCLNFICCTFTLKRDSYLFRTLFKFKCRFFKSLQDLLKSYIKYSVDFL